MGINVVSSIEAPINFSLNPYASFPTNPNALPDDFFWKNDQHVFDGQIVEPIAEAEQLAIFEGLPDGTAIVLNAEKNSIFNAFQSDNYSGDDSGSGKDDIQELLENQIMYLLQNNLAVTPPSGVLPVGESIELPVTLTSNDLAEGIYNGEIAVVSNDHINPEITVPVTLEVEYERFALTLDANPAGGGSASGQGSYYEGETVTLEASPNEGFMFVNWTLNEEEVSTSESFEFTMPGHAVNLTANFAVNTYTLTINTFGNGRVEVSGIPYLGPVTVNANSVISLVAFADNGWLFEAWSEEVSSNASATTVTMDGDKVITAYFNLITKIDTNNLTSVKVFPNPFSNSIILSNAHEVSRVIITNMFGVSLIDFEYSSTELITIPTDQLNEGVYLITLYNQHGDTILRKMVKNK
jgi:hypothetical protein